jgi:hypothetical protein
MFFILILIPLISVALGAIATFPFALISLLSLTILFRRSWVFPLAFSTGLFLDISQVRPLGASSIFFIVFIFMLFLYARKFEIQTMPFVIFSSFLGSLGYLLVFSYNHVFEQALLSSLIAVLLFKILSSKFKAQSENLQLKT